MYLTSRKKLENSFSGISELRWFIATNNLFVSFNNLNYRKMIIQGPLQKRCSVFCMCSCFTLILNFPTPPPLPLPTPTLLMRAHHFQYKIRFTFEFNEPLGRF